MHECIWDGYCNNTSNVDWDTLMGTSASINSFFANQAVEVKNANKIKNTFQLKDFKFLVGNEMVTLYQHVLATDETNGTPYYKQFALKLDLRETGSSDPD